VLARDQAFSGAKLRGLPHTAGLELLGDGCFHSRDELGLTEFVLSNLEPVLFSAEGMRGLTTQGVTLTLDVPRVADGVQVFERMMALAQRSPRPSAAWWWTTTARPSATRRWA
jgi:FtsZ-interacting cell division protein ZipA